MGTIMATFGKLAVFAAETRDEVVKVKELMERARSQEIAAYVMAGVGILLVIAAIAIAIYCDRKKKARKKALPPESKSTNKD